MQACAVGLGGGTPQLLGEHLRIHESFDHCRAEFLEALGLGQLPRFLDHRVIQRPLGGEHLLGDNAAGLVSQCLGKAA